MFKVGDWIEDTILDSGIGQIVTIAEEPEGFLSFGVVTETGMWLTSSLRSKLLEPTPQSYLELFQ